MNKKGFVLMETLVVTIFTLIIFTLLYTGIVPLLGKYDELSYYNNLDVTYDLFQIKKNFYSDTNYIALTNNNFKKITCNDFINKDKCQTILDQLGITNNDELIYFDLEKINEYKDSSNLSTDVKSYLNYLNNEDNKKILLLNKKNYISWLAY